MSLPAHLWQSTLCVGVAALMVLALRQTSARTRHAIWLCASLKFLVPFSALVTAGTVVGAWTSTTPELQNVARWLGQSVPRWYLEVPAEASGIGILSAMGRAGFRAMTLVWLTGAAGLTIWRWRQWRSIFRLARAATPLEYGREADALRRVARFSRGARRIALLECESRIAPGVLGISRPRILWPAGLSERLSDAELESVLAHEACHVDRSDNLAAFLQTVVEILFWFHPVVWLVGARLIHERERACDEEVLQMGTDKRRYAEGLLKVCGFCLRSPVAFVSGVGGPRLTERVEWIMRRAAPGAVTLPVRLLLGVVLTLTLGAPLGAGVLSVHHPLDQQERKVYRVGNGVTHPKLVYEVKPKYTREAMDAHIQGSVWLEAIVSDTGVVDDVKVTRSLDADLGLDQAAIDAVKQWRFEPATKDNQPVAVQVEIEISFRLK